MLKKSGGNPMSYFKDTTRWVKIDKWIIEKPKRMEKQDRGLRLSGQQNKISVDISEKDA